MQQYRSLFWRRHIRCCNGGDGDGIPSIGGLTFGKLTCLSINMFLKWISLQLEVLWCNIWTDFEEMSKHQLHGYVNIHIYVHNVINVRTDSPAHTKARTHTNIQALGGIRTHDRSRRAAVDLRLRPRGHWDRPFNANSHSNVKEILMFLFLECRWFFAWG